ncbi:MAG: hypothetical protein KTR19_08945, partial [Hyphomicrobiales bacterium]|nr:hypothetical protein [Hyphomicrobiales bacterium]
SYLGYPATMGAEFVDYIVGDPYITALDQQPFFNEKIVQLAECLMVAMPTGVIPQSAEAMDRHALGLPENGIVFCCFNPVRTISADCFAVWAGILKNTPGSVLWLLDDNDAATANLKRNAAALGVDPARLVFAPSRARNMHLARLPFADLYLDTTPSSSTVAIADALASGVPVLTCAGETMASRLSGSMLSACGLRDMITHALEHYEHAARMLTCNPRSLKQLRVRLANARQTAKFFDTEHYQSALDAAYEHMMAIARNGEWPYAFAVAPGKTNKQKNAAEQPQRTPREDQPFLLAEADVC